MASRGGRRRQRPRFVITYLPTILLIEMPFVLLFILDRDKSEAASNASQKRKKIFCFGLFFDNRSNAQSASKMGENSSIEKYLQKMFSLFSE